MESEDAVVEHNPEAAAATATGIRDAVKSAISEFISVETYRRLSWGRGNTPTIQNLGALLGETGGGLGQMSDADRARLLEDTSQRTQFEQGEGVVPSVTRARGRGHFSISELSRLFRREVAPAQLEQSSRRSYYRSWCTVVTWALAHESAHLCLPMSEEVLEALIMELLMMGNAVGSIKNIFHAISNRHRQFGLTPPLSEPGAYRRTIKALASIRGAPSRLIFPLGRHHIRGLLELIGLSWRQKRNVILVVIGTVMCARCSEPAQLTVCNVHFAVDAAYDKQYEGGVGIKVVKRKNDTGRRGLMTRIPPGELAERLRRWISAEHLGRNPRCTRDAAPGARCRFCPPLFPKTKWSPEACEPRLPMTRQNVTNAVKDCVAMLGLPSQQYSGISMRRGGLSAAIDAHVPEAILFLQSGHGKSKAGRRYMVPENPEILYATGEAILGL